MISSSWKIVSRKIPLSSISRHFSAWKTRIFVLDRENNLIITTESSGTVLICSILQISIKHHFYSTIDDPYTLSLKYITKSKSAASAARSDDFEMMLRFDSLETMSAFESVILEAIRVAQSQTGILTDETLRALSEYFKERLLLQEMSHPANEGEDKQVHSIATASSHHEHIGDKRVMFNENLEMEWSTWKETNLTNLVSDRFASTLSSKESMLIPDDGMISSSSSIDMPTTPTMKRDISSSIPHQLQHHHQPNLNFLYNPHSKVSLNFGSKSSNMKLPIPKLSILIMTVGTRGDVQPFCQIGQRLQQHGHRVRLATHRCFREYVSSTGLEYYPLAGDPHRLSQFMVKTHGNIIPSLSDLIHEVPKNLAMVAEIINSCWGACVSADPEDINAIPFIADAIISNPVTYGHIHCAEALGVPLHMMFPQPWLPTKAFPHPLSCMSYANQWSTENYLSYNMVDQMLWLSMRGIVNSFRTRILGIDPIRATDGGWNMMNSHKVPFVKLWSPALVPKPKDYPDYADISGTFSDVSINKVISPLPASEDHRSSPDALVADHRDDDQQYQAVNQKPAEYMPDAELSHFLSSSRKPIFVGFGSMVIEDAESVVRDFLDAAALVGVRIIIQAGWSAITPERFYQLTEQAEKKAMLVRDTEHHNNQSIIFPSPNKPPQSSSSLPVVGEDMIHNDKKVIITTRDDMDNLLASVESAPPSSTIIKSSASSIGNHDIDTFFDREADEGDEDYVTISDDNLMQSDAYDDLYSSGSKPSSLSQNISRHISGQVRKWFSLPSSADAMNISSSSSTSLNHQQHHQLHQHHQHHHPRITISSHNHHTDVKSHTKEFDDLHDDAHIHDHDDEHDTPWKRSDACLIGQCPHNWLFQQVAAVIHHGGAGTTSAGLQAGLPSWICPFFGDQHFWGEIVYRRGLGPKPCPVHELTLSSITEGMNMLLSHDVQAKAKDIASILSHEDGVTGATDSFYHHLPVDKMICDISLFLGESRLAHVYCQDCDFKLCREVSNCIHWGEKHHHHIVPLSYMNWHDDHQHHSIASADGIIQGLTGLVHGVADGVGDVIYQPVRDIYTDGIQGVPYAAAGMMHGLVKGLITQPISRVSAGLRTKTSTSTVTAGHHTSSSSSLSTSAASIAMHRRAEGNTYIIEKMLLMGHDHMDMKIEGGIEAIISGPSSPASSKHHRIIKVDQVEIQELILASSSSSLSPNAHHHDKGNISDNEVESEDPSTHDDGIDVVDDVNHDEPHESYDDVDNNLLVASDRDETSVNNDTCSLQASTMNPITNLLNPAIMDTDDIDKDPIILPDSVSFNDDHPSASLSSSSAAATSTVASISSSIVEAVAIDHQLSSSVINHEDDKTNKDDDKPPATITTTTDAQELWEQHQRNIIEAYTSATQIRQLISSITHNNARSLSNAEFIILIERAISRKEIISPSHDPHADNGDDSNWSTSEFDATTTSTSSSPSKNVSHIARTIAEQLSRNKDEVDFVDIALFMLEYGKEDGIWRDIIDADQINIQI